MNNCMRAGSMYAACVPVKSVFLVCDTDFFFKKLCMWQYPDQGKKSQAGAGALPAMT
jgi:hypothetical protein